MTHTLHRQGRLGDLEKDFVVFTMSAKNVNRAGSSDKMRRFFEIVEKYSSVNFGDMRTGNCFTADKDHIHDHIQDTSIVHFVFTDGEAVGEVLRELRQADLGTSVVVSGCVDIVDQLCKQAGLKMHTVEFSGGVHGRRELLPEEPVLEITTMCGHGLVASNLVKEMARQVKKGKRTAEEAAKELAKQCQCGVFNPVRAEHILSRLREMS